MRRKHFTYVFFEVAIIKKVEILNFLWTPSLLFVSRNTMAL